MFMEFTMISPRKIRIDICILIYIGGVTIRKAKSGRASFAEPIKSNGHTSEKLFQ